MPSNMRVADINTATSGDQTLIAAVTGRPIRIYQMFIVSSGAVNLIFKNGTTALNASAIPLTGAGSSITFQNTGQEWFRADPGNAFVCNLSDNVQITGQIYYTLG